MAIRLQPGAELLPGYRLVRYLGRGGFGEVWEATAPGGLPKAIKIVPTQTGESQDLRELEGLSRMRDIRHPYLLSIERFEIVDGYLLIVMELAESSLAERFEECVANGQPGIPRSELLMFLREAAEVLDKMSHEYGLQHLDIKPENLFISAGHIKVADFGLVRQRNSSVARETVAISPPYAPPELFDGRIEPTADVYSLAVTYQELLTGSRPYNAPDMRGLIYLHLRGKPDVKAVSPADRNVLLRAYQREPDKRYLSCCELVEALSQAAVFGTPDWAAEAYGESQDKANDDALSDTDTADAVGLTPQLMPYRRGKSGRASDETRRVQAKTTLIVDSPKRTRHAPPPDCETVKTTFVAFLPLEIYAHKLRGFIDTMDADLISCEDECAVLRFAMTRWMNLFGSNQSFFLQLDTCCRNENTGYRVVDATIWCTNKRIFGQELSRRGIMLVRVLKAHLMASDSKKPIFNEAEVRQAILG